MAKKNNNQKEKTSTLKEETVHGVIAIVFFILAVFFLMAAIEKGDSTMAGPVGKYLFQIFHYLLGVGYYLLPLILVMLGVSFWKTLERKVHFSKIAGGLLFLLACLGLISLISDTSGGMVGDLIAHPFLALFAFWTSAIILAGLIIISYFIIFDSRISLPSFSLGSFKLFGKKTVAEAEPLITSNGQKIEDTDEVEDDEPEEERMMPASKKALAQSSKKEEMVPEVFSFRSLNTTFVPPPLSLLETDKGKPGVGDIKANANIIKRTLQNFGIDVEMDEISIGPSVTRYALKPAEGVKISKIVGLQNNLSLALAAHPIRIEAPIPGKSLIGIEIPNSVKTTVGLGTLLAQEEFQKSDKPLLVSLGKGISGKSHFGNLAKMPHVLIAGATGSGKSVTIHSILTSLLYRNPPETLRFLMIDPKRVELTQYNKIPHLLTPVITDAKKTIVSLKWAAKEMDRRYEILEKESVRDIESYHKNVLQPKLKKLDGKEPAEGEEVPETMPYIVIIIDELADIMQAYPRELESAIVRLAQMSRAVGIHLMLSTQRPSVNVITGLIKANVPARIALQVASQIDSRTILDMRGAEELLGAGDTLYLGGEMSSPVRLQAAYISENEVKKVVSYIVNQYKDAIPNEINLTGNDEKNNTFGTISLDDSGDADDDDLYEVAREIVTRAGKASTSYLQRKLRIGYARAARLMDILEERGVIGPSDGSKPRDVIGFGGGEPSETSIDEV